MHSDNLQIKISRRNEEAVLLLSGRFDYGTSDHVRVVFNALLSEGFRSFMLDIRGLKYIDSSGLNELLYCYRTSEREGAKLSILVTPDRPRRTSHMRQVFSFLPVVCEGCDPSTACPVADAA